MFPRVSICEKIQGASSERRAFDSEKGFCDIAEPWTLSTSPLTSLAVASNGQER